MALGMPAQVLCKALAEGGWDAGPARSTGALEKASASSYKVLDVKYSQNRTKPMTNAISLRNPSVNVLSAEE